MTRSNPLTALVLHGGAGVLAERSYDAEIAHLHSLAEEGRAALDSGAPALDVVCDMVRALELSGLYVAGKGASPNRAGRYELDAAVMDGRARRAGAVSALEGFLSPVDAARAVMEHTPHVLLAGEGAAHFARERGLAPVRDPDGYYIPAAAPDTRAIPTGTVGAVALDASGALAAATSTGGTLNKVWGRVGDTPIIGSGTWADERAAVSCTGQGEFFMRANAAADVSARVRYAGSDLDAAVKGALDDVAHLGGEGGIIAVDASGAVSARYNSPGMKHAIAYPDGRITAGVT
ncbi:isoaspartyl peptidase/L-asparaginase [Alkalicaulis satelles]|uniref:Isoaspartyl peptidase n=1 Tax=Alkalicaulis satelles TaxID=2609175 RepID=A0A5M6ZC45_9PROT|nr:isoaspartyl peptidase/L-asparaginase [Alkalicaulis satelles]KAA5802289.1 isoaspartyl peptidase/L-asparaginase [Alkalicaulis satelles]